MREQSPWSVSVRTLSPVVDRNGQSIQFVTGSWNGLIMQNADYEEINSHVLQARWFAERLENMNEALAQYSGVFIGFLGIELVLLGQTPQEDFLRNSYSKSIALISSFLIILAIGLFFIALWSKKFEMPVLSDLRNAWNNPRENRKNETLDILISEDGPAGNIMRSLFEENEHLNRYYSWGIIAAGISQISLVVFVLSRRF